MKQLIALSAIIVLASCSREKDWVCSCKYSNSGDVITYDINKVKKKLAKERCDEYDNTYTSGTTQVTVSCELQ